MPIDFSPVGNQTLPLSRFSKRFTASDLRDATNDLIDAILAIINQASDEQVVFLPDDPEANDPFAVPGEEYIGWSLAHLVVHTTASLEEGAAYSSILARGIPYVREPRLRYETHWRSVTSKAQTIQRLEECRRMCQGYLATWPDEPHLDVLRDVSERYLERNGPQNATAAYLYGLWHMDNHMDQFRDVLRQAQAASAAASAG